MLGLLCARPLKPWNISPQTFSLHHHHHHHYHQSHSQPTNNVVDGASSVSIWRVNVPAAVASGDWRRDYLCPAIHQQLGEGSWNVACDARPARWLHRLDLAYLLYGVCVYLSFNDVVANDGVVGQTETIVGVVNEAESIVSEQGCCDLLDFRVTGVQPDGRCLFRAIAHGACLQTGEGVPDEDRQRELADDLRAKVVGELLKRRKEMEGFIDEDFDVYVERIQKPYVWGGELEVRMASHVLKNLISVFMKDQKTNKLTNISNYGEEYNDKYPINILFHGYGHYELLENS